MAEHDHRLEQLGVLAARTYRSRANQSFPEPPWPVNMKGERKRRLSIRPNCDLLHKMRMNGLYIHEYAALPADHLGPTRRDSSFTGTVERRAARGEVVDPAGQPLKYNTKTKYLNLHFLVSRLGAIGLDPLGLIAARVRHLEQGRCLVTLSITRRRVFTTSI